MKKIIASCTALLLLSACSSQLPKNIEYTSNYNSQNYSSYFQDDHAVLTGKVIYTTYNKQQFTCNVSYGVYLIPDTHYFRSLLTIDSHANYAFPGVNKKSLQTVRYVPCDKEGKFLFNHLPSEKWFMLSYLPTQHIWMKRKVTTRTNTHDEASLLNSDVLYHSVPVETIDILNYAKKHERPYKPLPWHAKGVK